MTRWQMYMYIFMYVYITDRKRCISSCLIREPYKKIRRNLILSFSHPLCECYRYGDEKVYSYI